MQIDHITLKPANRVLPQILFEFFQEKKTDKTVFSLAN